METPREHFFRQFQRDRARLIAYIRAITGDWAQAEDVFQEVSLVLLNKVDELEQEGDFSAWCRRVARNIARRERTKSQRMKAINDETVIGLIDEAFARSKPPAIYDVRRERLRECLQKLAPQSLEIVKMRYLTELSLRELADKLHRTEGAVQVALSRLRKTIGDCVQRQEEPSL